MKRLMPQQVVGGTRRGVTRARCVRRHYSGADVARPVVHRASLELVPTYAPCAQLLQDPRASLSVKTVPWCPPVGI